MKEDPLGLLSAGLRGLGLRRSPAIDSKLLAFAELLLSENAKTNLTGARSLGTLITDHILDSLAPLSFVGLLDPVVDLGSGAGLPGIPAAIAYPDHSFILLEPRAKRVAFLDLAIRELALRNASTIKSSARGPRATGLRDNAGTVLVRALANPTEALEQGMPMLKPGGTLLLYEGRAAHPSAAQRRAATKLGGASIVVKRVDVPGLLGARHAWIVRRPVRDYY